MMVGTMSEEGKGGWLWLGDTANAVIFTLQQQSVDSSVGSSHLRLMKSRSPRTPGGISSGTTSSPGRTRFFLHCTGSTSILPSSLTASLPARQGVATT